MSLIVFSNSVSSPPKSNNSKSMKPTNIGSICSLPDEIVVKCFAYVSRCDYPSLSLVSNTFCRLIASSELNFVRSLLQSTENVLYVALGFSREQNPIWYTLNRKPYKTESNFYNHKLVPITSLPSLPCWGSSVIVIGNEIYVFGGCVNGELTSNVFVIDCRFQTCRFLTSMRVARGCAALGVVDGKIYVIGGCNKTDSLNSWIEVFDVRKQSWECFSGLFNENLHERTIKSFVMNEKIYIMDRTKSFVYDPKVNTWKRENALNREWQVGSCIIDNMLYTFGSDNRISFYDPRIRVWRFVEGVVDLPDMRGIEGSRMANRGGNLVILFKRGNGGETKIWCIEIVLERRGQREIWGKVLWSNLVISLKNPPTIVQCLDVMI